MSKKILFLATIYESYPMMVPSLLQMTYRNWELVLIHDGPPKKFDYGKFFTYHDDPRIAFIQTHQRQQHYGHPNKTWGLNQVKEGKIGNDCEFLVIGNSDNYYVPGFCEIMLKGLEEPNILATYCAEMPHSYVGWSSMQCCLERGRIDIGQVMWHKYLAASQGWEGVEHSVDWDFIEKFIKTHGRWAFRQVNGALFFHN